MSGSTARRRRVVEALHDHDWHLLAVWHEEGHAMEEYGCSGCGDVTFR